MLIIQIMLLDTKAFFYVDLIIIINTNYHIALNASNHFYCATHPLPITFTTDKNFNCDIIQICANCIKTIKIMYIFYYN